MNRFLIGVAALLLAAPLCVEAQPVGKTARVGVLLFGTPETDMNFPTFRKSLGELGYVEGKNLTVVYRYAGGKPERLAKLAAELAALKPDVIFALGATSPRLPEPPPMQSPSSWRSARTR